MAFLSADATASHLSLTLPSGVPGAETLAGWEKITGEVETDGAAVAYELYVNPARPAIYEVTRYQVTVLTRDHGVITRREAETEKLVWHANPGHEVPRCFELRVPGGWTRMEAGSTPYRREMGVALFVYGLHRSAVLGRGEGAR